MPSDKDKTTKFQQAVPQPIDTEGAAVHRRKGKSGVGVHVRYCGHDASFIADVIEVGPAVVVVAAGPVNKPGVLTRPARRDATHLLVDFPTAGYWSPDEGVFVVPNAQVRLIGQGK